MSMLKKKEIQTLMVAHIHMESEGYQLLPPFQIVGIIVYINTCTHIITKFMANLIIVMLLTYHARLDYLRDKGRSS